MTYRFSKDVTFTGGSGAGFATVIFELKSLLTGSGWTVNKSGTGVNSASYSDSGDLILSATQLNSANAWFKIKMPSRTNEWTFQRTTNDATWRLKYCPTGFITTGSQTGSFNSTPHGINEVIVLGSATDASPTGLSWPNGTTDAMRAQIISDNASPYGAIMVAHKNGDGTITEAAWFTDPMLAGTYDPTDPDPYVAGMCRSVTILVANNSIQGMNYETSATSKHFAVFTGSMVPLAVHGNTYEVSDSSNGLQQVIPGGLGTNPFSSFDDLFLIPWIRRPGFGTSGGFKGYSSLLNWMGTTRSTGDTMSLLTTKDRYCFGNVTLPWDGTTPTV
jgi:hypothetical protein